MAHQNIADHQVTILRGTKIYSKHCRTDKKGRHPQSKPVGHRRKSFSGILQCCRIKVSKVSNKRRSVVLHDIVMIVHHHLGEENLGYLWTAGFIPGATKSLNVKLTSKGWPTTMKSHMLRFPALGPNLFSSHSLSCTWRFYVQIQFQNFFFLPKEHCTWSQWRARAWASSVGRRLCTHGRKRRRWRPLWSPRHETSLHKNDCFKGKAPKKKKCGWVVVKSIKLLSEHTIHCLYGNVRFHHF